MSALLSCTRCQATLLGEVYNTAALTPCPHCGALLEVEVFPALFKGLAVGQAGENLLVGGESSCFYHPQKKAVVPCDGCGRFLCALCDCEFNDQRLCPACLEIGKKKGKIKNLQNHRMLYDNLALALAVFPLLIFWLTIVTAPMALYLGIRYWNAPSSIIPRTKVRLLLAVLLASLQIVGWIILIYFIATR